VHGLQLRSQLFRRVVHHAPARSAPCTKRVSEVLGFTRFT
jgi:hypothetical protein